LPRRRDVVGAVYGQILVTAVIAAFSEYSGISAAETLSGVAVTILVFWVAHVYANAVAEQVSHERALTASDIRRVARDEAPMVQTAIPAMAVLGLGWAGALPDRAAINLAIAVGVVELVAWGFVIARRASLSPRGTAVAVTVNGALGLAIVGLKVAIH
jgi:hypothetical protein